MLKIEEQIIKHEGFEAKAFIGPRGALLIGFGRNLKTKGLSKDEARMLLRNDIADCEADLFKIFGKTFYDLDDNRRYALIDMHYTLGPTGFRGFREMIGVIKRGRFTLAAEEMKESDWYVDVGKNRAKTLYDMMLNGGDE